MKPFSILILASSTLALLGACSPFSSSQNEVQDDRVDSEELSTIRQDGPYLENMDENESAVELRVGASSSSLSQPKL